MKLFLMVCLLFSGFVFADEKYIYEKVLPYSAIKDSQARVEVIKALGLEGKQFKAYDEKSRVLYTFDRYGKDESAFWTTKERNKFLAHVLSIKEVRKYGDRENSLTLFADQVKQIDAKKGISKEEESALVRLSQEELEEALSAYRKMINGE